MATFFRAKCSQRAVFHSCSFDQYPPPLPPSTLSRESRTSATQPPYDGSLFQMQTPSLAFEALRRCDSLRKMRVNPFPATDPKKAAVNPFAATHAKFPSCKSFPCHTCKKQGVSPGERPGLIATLSPRRGRTISTPSYSRVACAHTFDRPRMFAYESR